MSALKATRAAQEVLCSEFVFNFDDTFVDINGVSKTFGAGGVAVALVADIIKLPKGAQIVGGDLVVETQGVGPTAYTAALGIAGDTACYLAANDLLAASSTRTALLLTKPLASNTGTDIRITMVNSVAAATAGKVRITVLWKLDGRATTAVPN